MTHIWGSRLTIIGSADGLSPGRRQSIIWTSAGILLIWALGTNFSEILIKIFNQENAFECVVSQLATRPFCHGCNVLKLRHG